MDKHQGGLLLFKTSTLQECITNKEVLLSKTVFSSCKVNYNTTNHLKDIFGNHHRFFRPYSHTTQSFDVHVIPDGYCFSDQEVYFTKNKTIIQDQFQYGVHPFKKSNYRFSKNKLLNSYYNTYLLWKSLKARLKLQYKIQKINGNVALLSRETQNCYGHFISDIIGAYYQILKFSLENNFKIDYFIISNHLIFQKEMCQLLGIQTHQIISAYPSKTIQAKNLIVPTLSADFEKVEYRNFYLNYRAITVPPFFQNMYDILLPPPPETKQIRKIYLTRSFSSNRHIINSNDVEEIFQEFGYEVILPDSLPLQKQIQIFRESKCIASVHGSGLMNTIFAQKNTIIFEIFPQFFHDNYPQLTAVTKCCNYHYMIAETQDISTSPGFEKLTINLNNLKEALVRLENMLE